MAVATGLNVEQAVTYLRQTLADMDTSGSGRWTDSTLIGFLDRAHKRAVRDILFPDSRVAVLTVAGVQLYQFPLMLKTHAVYLSGQLLVPSDLATMEGRQVNRWDATGDGSSTAGAYSDAPIGTTTGVASPQWAITSPLSYPSTNGQWTTPAPDAGPYNAYERPRYYWRGGWLGLSPAPSASGLVIEVDGVRQPDTITAATINGVQVTLPTPDNFLDVIIWGACSIAKFADDGQRSDAQRQVAEQNYDRERRKLEAWRGQYPGEQRNGPKPSVLRGAPGTFRMARRMHR